MSMQIKEKAHKTTCCYCGVGCGMLVEKSKQGKITVAGDPQNPVNKGMLCSKGMNLHYTAMDHSDRLLYPMLRDDLKKPLKRINWDTAIQKAASKFKQIIKQNGSEAVGFYVSGQCLTEEYYLANKIMKGFIGSNNIDTNSRLCMSSAVSAYKMALGEDSVPGCYEDIELADTFLIAGANPAWCHPILFRRIEAHKAKNKSIKIIVVDPRRTQTAAAADLHLQILPGTDVVLFHAIARGLIENGFIDKPFIEQHTEGFEKFLHKVKQRNLQEAAAICGIKFTDIYKAVKYIGYSGGFISLWAMGLNQSVNGVDKNLALINLSLITGKIGKPGSGPFSLTGQTNAMGGREVGGMATLLSAHRDLKKPAHRKEIADYWHVKNLPEKPGLTATEMFTALKEGRMKAIWIICTNPLVSIPDSNLVEAALQKADFVIVQDISSKADSIRFANLVLPAATWLEKEGTVTNSERRISHLSKVTDAPGEALPDAEILLKFAKAMGWEDYFKYASMAEVYKEHTGLTKNTNIDVSSLNYKKLKSSGAIQWPVTDATPYGTPRLFTDYRFHFPNRKAKIYAASDENDTEALSEDFPLILTTGRIRDQWHTMTRSGKVNKLKQHIAQPFLEIHPADADKRKIHNGDPVIVNSRRGTVQVTAHLTDDIKKGVVFLPMHWGKLAGKDFARANNLTNKMVDPISKQPGFKFSAVEVGRYQKPQQKIVITGESRCILTFIKKYRTFNMEDQIDWICADNESVFYDNRDINTYLKNDNFLSKQPNLIEIAEEQNINIIQGSIVDVDRKNKKVIDDKKKIHTYDQLIFGETFSKPNDENTLYWRNEKQMEELGQHLHLYNELVLTGDNDPVLCEAATILADEGIKVHIITQNKRLYEYILDETASGLLESVLIEMNIAIHFQEKIKKREPQKIILSSGEQINYDKIISFSFDAHTKVAEHAKLQVNKGICINEFLQTDDPNIFAIGEMTEYKNKLSFLPDAGHKQAECLANYFHGNLSEYYDGTVPFYEWRIRDWTITIIGKNIMLPEEEYEDVFFLDRQKYIYKKCFIQKDRLVGIIFMGGREGITEYRKWIEEGTELGDLREQLLRPGNAKPAVKGKLVCSCQQVGEGNIKEAIRAGCKTIEEIGIQTGAGTQCGSCKPELAEILEAN